MEPKVSDEYSAQLLEIPPSVITEIGTIWFKILKYAPGLYQK